MPRRERPIDPNGGPIAEFALLLRLERRVAGLTYRELAARTHYSHAHLVRAAGGDELPSWDVARAYLVGCGIAGTTLMAWEQLHRATRNDLEDDGSTPGPTVRARTVIRRIRNVRTPRELGELLFEISQRDGPRSLRELARHTGFAKSTLADWFAGHRTPSAVRLEKAAVLLGASEAETRELLLAREHTDDGAGSAPGFLAALQSVDGAASGEDREALRRLALTFIQTAELQDGYGGTGDETGKRLNAGLARQRLRIEHLRRMVDGSPPRHAASPAGSGH